MSLKIKRYFWGLVILSALGFVAVLGVEAYIKSKVINLVKNLDKNAEIDFSGSISLTDFSYNISDFTANIQLPATSKKSKISIQSLKYKIFGGSLSQIAHVKLIDSHGTLNADFFHILKGKEKNSKKITADNLKIKILNLGELKVSNPVVILSDNGNITASSDIVFALNNIKIALSKVNKKPTTIHLSIDNPNYSLSSDSSVDVNNLVIPQNKLDILKIASQIYFVKFHLVNKNIAGLNMDKLNTAYLSENLRTFKMYDSKYQPAVKLALDNFFQQKQDLYGYFHTTAFFSLGSNRISKPSLILANAPLPVKENELKNFRMPIDTPKNFEPDDKNSKDKDSKDKDSKDKNSKDKDSKDKNSKDKDSKDKNSKDKDSKKQQTKNDKPTLIPILTSEDKDK